jgi:predicted amidohydrolase
MTLLSRIHANQCAVVGCSRARAQDAQVCATCLGDLWANRLDRQPDGSYTKRRTFVARDETGRLAA